MQSGIAFDSPDALNFVGVMIGFGIVSRTSKSLSAVDRRPHFGKILKQPWDSDFIAASRGEVR
jgi:hypothetical protein